MKTGIRWLIETMASIILFAILLGFAQKALRPVGDSTKNVDGFYMLPPHSLDVCFVGASQMFCAIDAEKLTREYGIVSYDFGASGQTMPMTAYFVKEALKRQTPKLMVVEISRLFNAPVNLHDNTLSWTYDAMPLTWSKLSSAIDMTRNIGEALQYTFFPIIRTHSRWSTALMDNICYNLGLHAYGHSSRGFIKRDCVMSVKITYNSDEKGKEYVIPEKCIIALCDISDLCQKNGIEVLFFKAPVSTWTKEHSKAAREFFEAHDMVYLEMNDYLEEMNIDPGTDFCDEYHLNPSGAEKTTVFMARFIAENYDLEKGSWRASSQDNEKTWANTAITAKRLSVKRSHCFH